MTISLYTLCWNEHDVIPYAIQYWKRLKEQVDGFNVIVYDNHSTDDSVQLLKAYDWIEVRYFETDGMNDLIQRKIKDEAWKEARGKVDYVIVCDMDEVLYSSDLMSVLRTMKEGGYNVLGTPLYTLCGDSMPIYEEGKLLHELVGKGYKQRMNHHPKYEHLAKFMLFNPNRTIEMCPSVGWHICNPIPMKLYETDKVTAIHFDKGFSEDYFVNKRMKMAKRLSDTNKRNGFCYEYGWNEQRQREEYRKNQANAVNLNEVIK